MKAAPAWDIRPAAKAEPQEAADVETPAPVAETVVRNDTPPPAPVAAQVEQTEEQVEEAKAETALYESPEFQAEIAQDETPAEAKPSSPTPYTPPAKPVAEVAPPPPPAPPAKKKVATDF